MTYTIIAFYKFVAVGDTAALQSSLKAYCLRHELCGSILIAPEGINGTISGSKASIDAFVNFMRSDVRFSDLKVKTSWSAEKPFEKMKVRLKKEIITFGAPEANPADLVGEYVPPSEWNRLISDPAVTVVDTRNQYEVSLGTFERAIDPATESFTEFKAFVKNHLDPDKHKSVAMFCTGGIRCEKATAYLLKQGFAHVYHLEGGILKYLEEIPQEDSLFRGECYVFDSRISVANGLEVGSYEAVPHTDNVYIKKQ